MTPLTFGQLADEWLEMRRNIKPVSRAKYVHMLRKQINPWLGHRAVTSLTTEDLSVYVWAMDDAGYSPGTVRFAFTTTKAILDHAVRLRLITTNPARLLPAGERPRVARRTTRALSATQISLLLSAARQPYRTIFAIAIFAGLRSGEIRGLQWRDIDLDSNRVHVRRQAQFGQLVAPKTANAFREVALLDPLPAILRQWKAGQSVAEPSSLLFMDKGKPLLAPRLCYTLRATALRAGIERDPEEPPLRFHDLRHSFASVLIAARADVAFIARQLGHATPATTLNIYAHLFDEPANLDRVRRYVDSQFKGLTAHSKNESP